MTDIPVWAFVASTALTAGVALVPVLVEPARDRRIRENAERTASRQVRVARVEELFSEIDKASAALDEIFEGEVPRIYGPTDNNLTPANNVSVVFRVYAIITTHFPGAVPLVEASRDQVKTAVSTYGDKLRAGGAATPELSKSLRLTNTFDLIHIHTQFLTLVRNYLYDNSRSYID